MNLRAGKIFLSVNMNDKVTIHERQRINLFDYRSILAF